MISSFLGLQTSLRGLLAQQQALDVAAHNVANANTVGYTRQEASLGAADPLHLTAGAVGGRGVAGVELAAELAHEVVEEGELLAHEDAVYRVLAHDLGQQAA